MTVALLAALGGGWLYGASERREGERALRAVEVQNDLLEASVAVLAAHVSLYEADPAGVARHLDHARAFVGQADARLRLRGPFAGPQADLKSFCAGIDDAQRLAQTLDLVVPHDAASR